MKLCPICFTLTVVILFYTGMIAEAVKEVHKDCNACHKEHNYKVVNRDIKETCLKCHPASIGRDHPVGVASEIVPEGLPLDEGNKVTCITCHEPHGKNTVGQLLRKDFNKLCMSCHKV